MGGSDSERGRKFTARVMFARVQHHGLSLQVRRGCPAGQCPRSRLRRGGVVRAVPRQYCDQPENVDLHAWARSHCPAWPIWKARAVSVPPFPGRNRTASAEPRRSFVVRSAYRCPVVARMSLLSASRKVVASGDAVALSITCLAETSGPYARSMASLSGRNTPPDRLMPANRPCAREYASISAVN